MKLRCETEGVDAIISAIFLEKILTDKKTTAAAPGKQLNWQLPQIPVQPKLQPCLSYGSDGDRRAESCELRT